MRNRDVPKALIEGLLRRSIRPIPSREQPIAIWENKLPPVCDLPENNTTWDVANVSTQQQSAFFSKLPAEIRNMIYAYLFSEQDLEIEVVDKEIRCKRDKYQETAFQLCCPEAHQLLSFAKSCKLAYKETTPLTYTANTFHFPSPTALICFRRLVSPHFFQLIRSVHLTLNDTTRWLPDITAFMDNRTPAPFGASTWRRTCRELAAMEGLNRLKVDFIMGKLPYRSVACMLRPWEFVLLAPLEELKMVEGLDVRISWGAEQVMVFGDEGREWGFRVEREWRVC